MGEFGVILRCKHALATMGFKGSGAGACRRVASVFFDLKQSPKVVEEPSRFLRQFMEFDGWVCCGSTGESEISMKQQGLTYFGWFCAWVLEASQGSLTLGEWSSVVGCDELGAREGSGLSTSTCCTT